MHIIRYYLTASVLLLIAAYFSKSWYFSAILGWGGLSLLAVSMAYISDKPRIFRKKEDGSIPFYINWLLLPFLVAVQLYNTWARKNDRVPAIQKIRPNLYLACRLFPSDMSYLKDQKVRGILDATAEFSGLNWSANDDSLHYLNVPILDHKTPHTVDLIRAVNWLTHHIENGRGVVVHCALGRGRSVLILAAYLLASKTCTSVDSALQLINQTRQTAKLNPRQYKKLCEVFESGALNQQKQILLIANPVSGKGSWEIHRQEIEQRLSTKYKLTIETTSKTKTARSIVQQYKDSNLSLIVACGGDGTVNEVAAEICDTDKCMAIIPMGTTNALSHALFGLSAKLSPVEKACDIILNGHLKLIDTAKCNDDVMLLVAGFGFEQKMITMADRDSKNSLGEFAYLNALGCAIRENKSETYTLEIDDKPPQRIDTASLVVANAAPFTTLLAQGNGAPSPSDGKLNMTLLDTSQQVVMPLAALGLKSIALPWLSEQNISGVTHQTLTKITIKGEHKQPIDYVVDGEVRQSERIHIQVNPSSLAIMHLV